MFISPFLFFSETLSLILWWSFVAILIPDSLGLSVNGEVFLYESSRTTRCFCKEINPCSILSDHCNYSFVQ
ncbi:hypothetical protein L2E82_48298 [Cichorium intybus]|uniref:Uncharacterized protein n=1 Tax=Cichorium intybus TaxID=13427 RepID=A0ACB8YYY8_CICIN|nr:hypothetical protein L2E82_48298 [Cichorium intybus]